MVAQRSNCPWRRVKQVHTRGAGHGSPVAITAARAWHRVRPAMAVSSRMKDLRDRFATPRASVHDGTQTPARPGHYTYQQEASPR